MRKYSTYKSIYNAKQVSSQKTTVKSNLTGKWTMNINMQTSKC